MNYKITGLPSPSSQADTVTTDYVDKMMLRVEWMGYIGGGMDYFRSAIGMLRRGAAGGFEYIGPMSWYKDIELEDYGKRYEQMSSTRLGKIILEQK